MAQHIKTQSTHTLMLSCLLPVLSGACSWVQALQDNPMMTSTDSAPEQITAMSVTETQVRMLYPPETDTIARAVEHILSPHAYRAARPDRAGEMIAQRGFINNFGAEPVPVVEALQRLLGPDGQLALDQANKLYTFRLKRAHEPGLVFANLLLAPAGDAQESIANLSALPPAQTAEPALTSDDRAVADAAASAAEAAPAKNSADVDATLPEPESEPVISAGNTDAEHGDACHFIRFKNRAMLSATVREYFLDCGFDEALWRLGQPDRYADYRLMQNLEVPLPEHHHDLIKLLQSRFNIRTLIHDNNRVEFQDENNAF